MKARSWRSSIQDWVVRTLLVAAILTSPLTAMAQSICSTSVHVTPYTKMNDRLESVPMVDIQARVNGRPVRVTSILPERKPVHAVLVLDASGSMQSFGESDKSNVKWQIVLELAQKIVTFAQPSSTLGLLAFSGKDQRTVPLTADTGALLKALKELREYRGDEHASDHKSPLWDAIKQADLLLPSGSTHDALIVLSDGGDNASSASLGTLQRNLAQLSVPVFAVVFLDAGPRTEEEIAGPRDLRSLAENSGGFVTELNFEKLRQEKPEKIEQAFVTTANAILAFTNKSYEVSLERDHPSSKPEKLELRTKNMRLTYPHFVPPCARP